MFANSHRKHCAQVAAEKFDGVIGPLELNFLAIVFVIVIGQSL